MEGGRTRAELLASRTTGAPEYRAPERCAFQPWVFQRALTGYVRASRHTRFATTAVDVTATRIAAFFRRAAAISRTATVAGTPPARSSPARSAAARTSAAGADRRAAARPASPGVARTHQHAAFHATRSTRA